jgi:uncharacterized membrane protein
MTINKYFSKEDREKIISAIKKAELDTSGEIKVHIDKSCKGDPLDQAAFIFKKLKMHKTNLRNGVLFYLALENRKFAIIGDAGINNVVAENFWDEIKKSMLDEFMNDRLTEGLVKGITMAGEQLKKHFPYRKDDLNELSDDISFGK